MGTTTEEAISRQSAVRLMGWLRAEVERLPSWHPLQAEYASQLADLERRQPLGPRQVVV
jgi:hypothetical protein